MAEQMEDQCYVIPTDNLEQLIVNELLKQSISPAQTQSDVDALQAQIKLQERRHREISRIFDNCRQLMDKFESEHGKDTQEVEQEPEAMVIASSSESDDDVQFVEATYEPMMLSKKSTPTGQAVAQAVMTQPLRPNPLLPTNNTPHQQPFQPSLPSQSVRSPFTPAAPSGGNAGTTLLSMILTQMPGPQEVAVSQTTSYAPCRQIELAVGMKLYGKKFNEIWYKGTLVDIQSRDAARHMRRYKVKFDGKGMKILTGKHIAFHDNSKEILPVGSRVVAAYKEGESCGVNSYYAGIIAEPPNVRNNHRYLIFFDDGYAQYSTIQELHRVVDQSRNVWEDIHPDSSDFIRGYLQQYPERPMVRLQKGQMVKTEWNGKWWVSRVQEVDASLVKMYFEADKRVEWIYRGSTRLEPLFTELANAEASKVLGKGRRHNVQLKSKQKPFVEYTRGSEQSAKKSTTTAVRSDTAAAAAAVSTDGQKRRSVAKKSSTKAARMLTTDQTVTSNVGPARKSYPKNLDKLSLDALNLDCERGKNLDALNLDESILGERVEVVTLRKTDPIPVFVAHTCNPNCIKKISDDPRKHLGSNPLLIPQLCGWERVVSKSSQNGRRCIFYRAPCARRLRNLDEVDKYLDMTRSKLTIDLFCFDIQLDTMSEFVPVKTFCNIRDISYGKEVVPISCVNGIDRQYPYYVEYSNVRTPAKGVKLNLESEFLLGCDCTDGCRDPTKCRCMQLTIEARNTLNRDPHQMGYRHRRLDEYHSTGVYECNSTCKCDYRCANRVAQHGLQLRLQVFKTEKRGWGLRCLDDIPAGGFICIYVGQLLTEQGANEDGQQYGDEYLAELDYMEVVERMKEGYESDVEPEPSDDSLSDAVEIAQDDSDSSYSGGKESKGKCKKPVKLILTREGTDCNDNSGWSVKSVADQEKTEAWVKSILDDTIVIISDDEGDSPAPPVVPVDELPDLDDSSPTTDSTQDSDGVTIKITDPTSLNMDGLKCDDSDEENATKVDKDFKRKTRSQTHSRFSNLPNPKTKTSTQQKKTEETEKQTIASTRSYFGEQFCYVMDAKSMGNLGRYLNHSCTPNAFVQNVFVDTHDLRFPWIAFFASEYIRAGTELTWDYNYEVGSVPGKVLYCYCGSAECRGRLL